MMAALQQDWATQNQQLLRTELASVRANIEGLPAPLIESGTRSALDLLCEAFGLSSFERKILVLCAGMELDSALAELCERSATFGLALRTFPEAHWSALSPASALRRWRLIEVGPGPALTASPLRIDERILDYLVGVSNFDQRLSMYAEALPAPAAIAPLHRQIADRVAGWFIEAADRGEVPAFQLCGEDTPAKRAIAGHVGQLLNFPMYSVPANLIPHATEDQENFLRLWAREAALSRAVLFLDWESETTAPVKRFIRRYRGPLLLASRERQPDLGRALTSFDVAKPDARERQDLWRQVLGEDMPVSAALSQFSLGAEAIQAAGAEALSSSESDFSGALWDACRKQARPRLDDLAQRVLARSHWDDLVLPAAQMGTLRDIAAQVRNRFQVYEEWGFARPGERGLGIGALFAGPSGTGKTMAAEVLANELHLDLYRIDLSQVVSKYIGETEKNLRRAFEAAEEGGAVLLFDEADAIFGKRSEGKDSHDRYANLEVSSLLQRMETYAGLAILTTNMKSAIDPAFHRRLRFSVQFSFPDAAQRAAIWKRSFPPDAPTRNLRFDVLARLNLAGGNIRNVALNAAFLASEACEPIGMKHLALAARGELGKLERPVSEAEMGDWV